MHQTELSAAFEAIGTRWKLSVSDTLGATDWQYLMQGVRTRIDEFDAVYSRFRSDSFVSKLAKQAGTYPMPPDGYELFRWYEQLYRSTDGLVTPLIGQTLSDRGYDANYSLKSADTVAETPVWESVLSYSKTSLQLRQPALLDFGAAGKGYLVDIIGELLEAAGVQNYILDAGGDVRYRSAAGSSSTIGLENPLDASEAIGTIELGQESLAASAIGKRRWASYHHILNPKSGQAVEAILATWVTAATTMQADGLATALFFVPPSQLRRQFDFKYAMMDATGGFTYSADFPVTLFEAE